MCTITQVRNALEGMFRDCATQANIEHPVILRQRVFTAESLAKTYVLSMLQDPNAGSEQIAAMAASCNAPVTKQAVDKRDEPKTAGFLEALFRRATQLIVQSDQVLAPILERFTQVIVSDSSSISLPDSCQERFRGRGGTNGCCKSALKLQTEVELRSGRLTCVDIEQGKDADVASPRQWVKREAGTLRIADLGYFNIDVFIKLAICAAYFLSRIQRTTLLRIDGEVVGNVGTWLSKCKETVVDRWLVIGTQKRLSCRLIAWRVPLEVAGNRRRKLYLDHKKRRRNGPTQEALSACDWTFLVTNLPSEKLSVKEAIVLYRARWQIELLFKRWKSIGLVATLSGHTEARQMVRFWARLCAALIQHWLTVLCGWRADALISFTRIAKRISANVDLLAFGLSDMATSQQRLDEILAHFRMKTKLPARQDKHRKPGTIELLRNPELLDYALS